MYGGFYELHHWLNGIHYRVLRVARHTLHIEQARTAEAVETEAGDMVKRTDEYLAQKIIRYISVKPRFVYDINLRFGGITRGHYTYDDVKRICNGLRESGAIVLNDELMYEMREHEQVDGDWPAGEYRR